MRAGAWFGWIATTASAGRLALACTGDDPVLVVAAEAGSDAVTPPFMPVSDAAPASDGALSPDEYRALVLADQPVVYWRMASFDDAGVVKDERDASDLVLGAGVFTITEDDAFGPSLHFDGDAGYGTATRPSLLQFPAGHPFTFEAWTKLDAIDVNRYDMVGGSATSYHDSGAFDGYMLFWSNDAHRVDGQLFFHDGGPQTAADATTRLGTTWKHCAMTVDAVLTVKLFVDGKLTPQQGAAATAPAAGSVTFTVGRDPRSLANFWFGNLAEIALYPRALDRDEIAAHARRRH